MKLAKPPETETTIRFNAQLDRPKATGKNGSGALLSLPKKASTQFPAKGKTMIEGTMAGFPFRAPLEGGEIRISQTLLKACNVKEGDAVTVELTRIGDEPEVMVPDDLQEALNKAPKAQSLWKVVTPMARREWVRWIASAKQEETRMRRIEVGIDKLTKGMRRPCCFPGLNWVTKDHVSPDETWAALPSTKTKAKK